MATMNSDNEVQAKELDSKPKACYNRDVDDMRETEFPMLQGSTRNQKTSRTKIHGLSRLDLPRPRWYYAISQITYRCFFQGYAVQPPRKSSLSFHVLSTIDTANRRCTITSITALQCRPGQLRPGLRGKCYSRCEVGHGGFSRKGGGVLVWIP